MKKQIIIFAMLFAFNLLGAQTKGNTIVGKWTGTDERNQTGGIEFMENGKAKLLVSGQQIPQCDYKVDYQKDPIAINLMIRRNGKTLTMYGLIKFIDKNTIKWEIFPAADKQPKAFSGQPAGNSIVLKRSKA